MWRSCRKMRSEQSGSILGRLTISSKALILCRQVRPSPPSMRSIDRGGGSSPFPIRRRPEAHDGPHRTVEEVPSVDQMTEMARRGQGDAFALSHDSFAGLLPKLPGARVLPGNFQQTGIAIAVPKGRPAALKIASELLEVAKTSGQVRRALDAAGFPEAAVAP